MLRFITTTLAALAIVAGPLAAFAEKKNEADPAAFETVVVAQAEDAFPALPAVRSETPAERVTEKAAPVRAAHGSSQSYGTFRFSNPYAFPQQTLPLSFPSFPSLGF